MTDKYRAESKGKNISLMPNNPEVGAAAHALYIGISNLSGSETSAALYTKKEIREFVYAAAVNGGLVKAGEVLTLDPGERELPADGLYVLNTSMLDMIVSVRHGKLLVPQMNGNKFNGVAADCTDMYTVSNSAWVLTPIVEKGTNE